MADTRRYGVMPLRQRADIGREILLERLEKVLPEAMRRAGLDMWLVICQEDDLDPIFPLLVPPDSWCPILQMLIFHDTGERVDRINLSMTNTGSLYDRPWQGRDHDEQWPLLAQIIGERDPARIGINTGRVQWAAGGLTHNLYAQLVQALPPEYAARLESAETLVTHWAATLTPREIELYEHVVAVAHGLLGDCLSPRTIIPGVTTTDDLSGTTGNVPLIWVSRYPSSPSSTQSAAGRTVRSMVLTTEPSARMTSSTPMWASAIWG